ncbi:carboxylesterase [Ahniella affigens]|uniref:Carboxylesterase n=1 Tax=Ahniella affigens TaxID=2021234 RepID=A0A2P1PZ72_9GAMM|nr:carboxylesterase [Ahniella affigens]AVQ00152.1 carboxylesterase [Ahniella affigens]
MPHVLETIEIETRPNPTHSVIWLHGLGADGHDFEPIVPELVRPTWPGLRFIFPHAPVRPVTINGGVRMRAWYDILGMEIAQRQDEAGVRQSIEQVQALLERETTRGIPPARQFLAGFSQGGAITLALTVRRNETLAGAIALSTYLPIAGSLPAELGSAARGIPVFMGHGAMDPVVPQGLGLMSRGTLTQLGFPLTWHSYPMPHSVCAEEIRHIADWMEERLA